MSSAKPNPLDVAELSRSNFIDLINLADADATLLPKIRNDYMIAKYGIDKKEHCIDCFDTTQPAITYTINLSDYQTAAKYFRLFGDLVTRLTFWGGYTFSPSESDALGQLIEQRCSKSLVKLVIYGERFSYLLGKAREQFSHVQQVGLYGLHSPYNYDLARIYPQMQSLTFEIFSLESVEALARPYASLTNVSIISLGRAQNFTNLKRLFALNPQIRSVNSPSFPKTELLQFMSEKLVQLNSLSFECGTNSPAEGDPVVNFASVEFLNISATRFCPRTLPLTFDRLNCARFGVYDINKDEIYRLLFSLPAIGTGEERSTGTLPDGWTAQLGQSGEVEFSRQGAMSVDSHADKNQLKPFASRLVEKASKLGNKVKHRAFGKK